MEKNGGVWKPKGTKGNKKETFIKKKKDCQQDDECNVKYLLQQ